MRKTLKKTLKKLRARAGLTMVETLAAVAVLTLLCLALGSGLNLAVHAYRTIIAQSETELLLSTAADAIIDELRFARIRTLEAGDKLDVYDSQRYGAYAILAVNDGKLVVKNFSSPDEGHPLLASGVYGKPDADDKQPYQLDLGDGITYDEAARIFTFTLRAEMPGIASAERTFYVRCLNGGTIS